VENIAALIQGTRLDVYFSPPSPVNSVKRQLAQRWRDPKISPKIEVSSLFFFTTPTEVI